MVKCTVRLLATRTLQEWIDNEQLQKFIDTQSFNKIEYDVEAHYTSAADDVRYYSCTIYDIVLSDIQDVTTLDLPSYTVSKVEKIGSSAPADKFRTFLNNLFKECKFTEETQKLVLNMTLQEFLNNLEGKEEVKKDMTVITPSELYEVVYNRKCPICGGKVNTIDDMMKCGSCGFDFGDKATALQMLSSDR